MKIRHKQSGVVIEDCFCVEMAVDEYGRVREYFKPPHSLSRFDGLAWEEVKPVWKDVTAECETSKDNDIIHEGCARYLRYFPHNDDGYRLRKVKLYAGYCSTEQQDAFIIEQRQA